MKVGDLLTPVSDFFCDYKLGCCGYVGGNAEPSFGVAGIQNVL